MSVNKDLRWLRIPGLKGAAKRFTEFCKTDALLQAKTDPEFDSGIYSEAAKLIIKRLHPLSSNENTAYQNTVLLL